MDIIDAWSRNLAMASCDLKSKRESSIRLIVFHTVLRIGLQQALCCCIEFNSISIWRGVYSDTTQLNSTSSWVELCRYKHPFMRLALYNIVTSLVGWSLVGHVRELWLNGASEASYCWTPVLWNSVFQSCHFQPLAWPLKWDLGPTIVIRATEGILPYCYGTCFFVRKQKLLFFYFLLLCTFIF